ncbi:MAG: radical SAM protein [Methanobacterium sp.]|nr:radical SAM protein [Methanobacterium sp.]
MMVEKRLAVERVMMDVLLIQPDKLPGLRTTRSSIPISLLYLGAALRNRGYQPYIWDLSTQNLPAEGAERREKIESFFRKNFMGISTKVVGINCFTTMHFPLVREIAAIIKSIDENIKIIIGGAHPTFFGEDILKNCPEIDYISIGEGEETIIGVIDAITNNMGFSEIPALLYRDGKSVRTNNRIEYISDIESFEMPAWDLIDISLYRGNYETYYNPKKQNFSLTVPIITSRSCPFSCSFCSAHLIMGKKYRKKSAIQVVDEIQFIHERYGENYFAFLDDIINIDKSHVIDICKEIVKRNLNIQFSINQGLYISLVDEEMVDALYEAGLVTVSLPIEHGDENIRRNVLRKKLTNDKIYEVAGYIKKHNIFTIGLFIMGFPEETEDTLERTRKFIIDLSLDINGVSNLIPFPRTSIHDQAVRDGLFVVDTGEVWEGKAYFDPGNRNDFFIKPRNSDLNVLRRYRKIFDDMYFFTDRAKNLNQGKC